VELTVRPARMNSLHTIPLISKKIMSMLLTLLFTCFAFFSVSVSLDFPCMAHAFFTERLSKLCQGVRRFPPPPPQDLHTVLCCSFVRSIMKLHQARYTTPNKRTYKISMSTQLHEILYTDSQDILYCCIALLQLLYRWQHQSLKLWRTPHINTS
jgi:hypothetical protein